MEKDQGKRQQIEEPSTPSDGIKTEKKAPVDVCIFVAKNESMHGFAETTLFLEKLDEDSDKENRPVRKTGGRELPIPKPLGNFDAHVRAADPLKRFRPVRRR